MNIEEWMIVFHFWVKGLFSIADIQILHQSMAFVILEAFSQSQMICI